MQPPFKPLHPVSQLGRWWAFFGAGTLMLLVTLLMSFSDFIYFDYVEGVLVYAFATGMAGAAFSAIILHAIGGGLAVTKFALISSIGNIPAVYMTAANGWVHDAYNIRAMLLGETFLSLFFIVLSLFILSKMKFNKISNNNYLLGENQPNREQ